MELIEQNFFYLLVFLFSSRGECTSFAGADDTGPVVTNIRISSPHAPHHHSVVLSHAGQTAMSLVTRL